MSGTINQKIRQVADTINQRTRGVPTGFHLWDHHTFGLHPQELTIIAGRPAMGKSSLLADLAINTSIHCPVMIFSLEMPETLLMERMLSDKAEVSLRRLKQPELLDEEEIKRRDRAILAFENRDIVINDSSILTPEQICKFMESFRGMVSSLYQSQKYKYDTGVVLLDYLGLLEAGKWTQNTNDKLDYFVKVIRQAAKDLNLIFVLLHQLNRKVEDRPNHEPRLSDLRDSGAIEQHADNVILLHRPAYYKMKDLGEDIEDDGEAYLLLAKQRNGATGKIPVVYIPEVMGFRNMGSWCGQPDQTPLLDSLPETPVFPTEETNPIQETIIDTTEETEPDEDVEIVGEIKSYNPPNELVEVDDIPI